MGLLLCLAAGAVRAQKKTIVLDSSGSGNTRTVIAGKYKNTSFHRFLFGKHYRDEWATPVKVKMMMLDTAGNKLKPYGVGGGRQTISIRMKDANDREYVLRSLDKSFGKAMPEIMQGTFLEDILDDQVTIAHPYAAITIPDMAEAAGILHTNPIIRYVPHQPALDTFNTQYGNMLYLLEQRPDGNWATTPNFGNSEKIISTGKLMEKLLASTNNEIDQQLYIRSRLFDMFIGDWGRHEDQWRWAEFKQGDKRIYKPIPRDRDQAYTLFDGLLPKFALRAADQQRLQSFDYKVKSIKSYNYSARYLDRRMANETTLEQWTAAARDLQSKMTDALIERSIRKMPPEVFALSGEEIIAKLKSRRDLLEKYAADYYKFMARHVDVVGSNEREYFEVKRLNDDETAVNIYRINEDNNISKEPSYSRTFKTDETKDVRIHGIDNNDVYKVDGQVRDAIVVRLIGGDDRDSIIDQSDIRGHSGMTVVYDDRNNYFLKSKETNLQLGNDSAVHAYNYQEFDYHSKGPKVSISYNNPDRLFLGVGYKFHRHFWRRYPHSFEQSLSVRYSIAQNAVSLVYSGIFYQAVGKWDLRFNASQDFVRWTNFFGLGNETKRVVDDRRYYQLRTSEFIGSVGLARNFNRHHSLEITGFYSGVEVLEDPNRFVSQNFTPNELFYFHHHQYLGARVGYTFQHIDNVFIPEKGIMFYAGASYANNILLENVGFKTYNSILQLYIPLIKRFSISSRTGVTSVAGKPEFYQYATVGGSQTIRGYRRDRFWGKTAFYSSNELRWITDFRSYFMNGKIGLLGFVDNGRVWMPGEKSDKFHVGYGGGIFLAPFNRISMSLALGRSEEGSTIHFRINRLLQPVRNFYQ